MDACKLAYIAGLFDGEGCIVIVEDYPSFYVRTQVTNTNKEVLDLLQENFKGCICKHKEENRRDYYVWQASCGVAILFLKAIYPFLRIKKEKARLAIEFEKGRKKREYPVSKEELKRRRKYKELVSKS